VRWAGHVARMGIREMHIGYWWESQKERDLRPENGDRIQSPKRCVLKKKQNGFLNNRQDDG
jgi:hypothetical protein